MLLALWLSFKRGKQKVRKIKKRSGDPADWDPNHPVQQTYEEIIEKNGIPAGWRKWGYYFRWISVKGYGKLKLRVLRIGHKKPEGGYETHGILFSDAIPYKENTAVYYLKYMKAAEHAQPEEIWELRDRAYSWLYWFRKKIDEEQKNLTDLGLTVHSEIIDICRAFVTKLSRQFFQRSSLKVRSLEDIAT